MTTNIMKCELHKINIGEKSDKTKKYFKIRTI